MFAIFSAFRRPRLPLSSLVAFCPSSRMMKPCAFSAIRFHETRSSTFALALPLLFCTMAVLPRSCCTSFAIALLVGFILLVQTRRHCPHLCARKFDPRAILCCFCLSLCRRPCFRAAGPEESINYHFIFACYLIPCSSCSHYLLFSLGSTFSCPFSAGSNVEHFSSFCDNSVL